MTTIRGPRLQRLSELSRLLSLRDLPLRPLGFTLIASLAGLAIGIGSAWPLWLIGLAITIPWLPFITVETVHATRSFGWLALFYVLVITQGGHVLEHAGQMVQIHLLQLNPPHTHGIFGQLDIEWVHFAWNTTVLAAIVLLWWRFSANRWLILACAFALWHQTEHAVIMVHFLDTGVEGTPGLLASGGHVSGGLPVTRPDLHFLYNVIETIPLMLAYFWQVRHTLEHVAANNVTPHRDRSEASINRAEALIDR